MTAAEIEAWRAVHNRQHNRFVALVIAAQIVIVAVAVLAC